ncbi:MAG: ABC transporter permease [Candidatus Omnitrophica bacterium]|nr:ABC transporter permease [Candidatus Omnitrophota bacterium]
MQSNNIYQFITRQFSLVTLCQDIRYGLRQLIKTPGFTITAVLILAIGIGVNTTIFSVINAVLLRSLPTPNPHELRTINWTGRNPKLSYYTGTGMGTISGGLMYSGSFPYTAYQRFRDKGQGFSEVFAFFSVNRATTLTRGMASTADGMMVSENFFTGYGSRMALGRTFAPEEGEIGSEPVAVITYRLWDRCFSLDPNVLGETISINKHLFTVIGVLSNDFVGPQPGDPADFYVPMSAQPQLRPSSPLSSSKHWWIQIMARMAPGANEVQAQGSLAALFQSVLEESVTTMDQPGIWLEDGSRGPLMLRQRIAQPFWALMVLVGFVLMIACANLASLLLVRGSARRREMAVRTALGAGRWRLIRQSLTESILLSILGAGAGLLFALWCKELLQGILLQYQSNFRIDFRIDAHVLFFTLCLAVLTAILFGLLPAMRAAHADPAAGLMDRQANTAPRLRTGRILVAVQAGMSVLLVMGAGLLVQSFANLKNLDPGFDSENILLFRLNAEQAGYTERERIDFYENAERSIRHIPGVSAVAFSNLAFGGGWSSESRITLPARGSVSGQHLQTCQMVINDTFFQAMKLPMLLGRDFNASDSSSSVKVSVVNETFVKNFLQDEPPVGIYFRMEESDYRIVGVCGDSVYKNVKENRLPIAYFSHRQQAPNSVFFEVRASLPPLSLAPAVRKTVAALDETIPLENIKTQQRQLDDSILFDRIFAVLCGSLAALAVILSCIGLYGLMTYNVARRRGEIGIRMALGAQPRDVSWPILRDALMLVFRGVSVGAPAALALGIVIRSFLFGVQPYDLTALLGAIALLTAAAALAAWIPARRAARTDPMDALRCE